MSLAFLASTRSPDSQTKHGCVIVDNNHRILSLGYNGFLACINDEDMANTRPLKYGLVAHAERNALSNCMLPPTGAIAYITGQSCIECIKAMYQAGIKEFVMADSHGSFAITEEEEAFFEYLVHFGHIKVRRINTNLDHVTQLLKDKGVIDGNPK